MPLSVHVTVTATLLSLVQSHQFCYPTVLHSCRHLLDSLHWPYHPLCMSLGFCFPCSSSFLKASPAHLQTFFYDTTVLSINSHAIQQTPATLKTNLEPWCWRGTVSPDGNKAHFDLTSIETEKISSQDCINRKRGKKKSN